MSQEGGHYYVPPLSPWPITGSIALLFMGFGAAFSVNKLPLGYGLLAMGFAILIYMMFGWFAFHSTARSATRSQLTERCRPWTSTLKT